MGLRGLISSMRVGEETLELLSTFILKPSTFSVSLTVFRFQELSEAREDALPELNRFDT